MPSEKIWKQYAKRADATLAVITAERDSLKCQLEISERKVKVLEAIAAGALTDPCLD